MTYLSSQGRVLGLAELLWNRGTYRAREEGCLVAVTLPEHEDNGRVRHHPEAGGLSTPIPQTGLLGFSATLLLSPEPLQRPEKLKEEMMSSAGDTQDEVLVEAGTSEGARGAGKEEIEPLVNIYATGSRP